MTFNNVKNIFLIGIGGIGMSALARYFKTKKKDVMGYDREYSEITDALQKSGVIITYDELDYSTIDKLESHQREMIAYFNKQLIALEEEQKASNSEVLKLASMQNFNSPKPQKNKNTFILQRKYSTFNKIKSNKVLLIVATASFLGILVLNFF